MRIKSVKKERDDDKKKKKKRLGERGGRERAHKNEEGKCYK